MSDILEGLGAMTLIFLVIVFVFLGPLAIIWAFNALGFVVPYTLKTYFAGIVLIIFFGGRS